jgi:cytochrome c peroxidase
VLSAFACASLLFSACRKDVSIPEGHVEPLLVLPLEPLSYTIPTLPSHFQQDLFLSDQTPENNPVTDAGATLGRVLFYDQDLSANRSKSCGSCHHQEHGFADVRVLSEGFNGQHTHRNALHLVNAFYSRRQFWDQRAPTLEAQVLMPIQDPIEMGMSLEEAVSRVQRHDHYAPLFAEAFGDDGVTADRVARALAQFVRSMVSYRTRYDVGEGTGFANFTPLEADGLTIFSSGRARCRQCHTTTNFFNDESRNNGLDSIYADNGLGALNGDPADNGKFKVPSLRNVELTAPYMHDGRFATLEEVVEHYNSEVEQHPNLNDRMTVNGHTGGVPVRLELSDYEKQALVAFLKTLTDVPMVTDPKFSDPFVRQP